MLRGFAGNNIVYNPLCHHRCHIAYYEKECIYFSYAFTMDFVLEFANEYKIYKEFEEEINELCEEHNFGYRLVSFDDFTGSSFCWELYKEPEFEVKSLETAEEAVVDICEQSRLHIQQARNQLLKSSTNERARKDAIRDSLSAMEALISHFGKGPDIKQSTKKLRDDKKWGSDIIIKDGLSIWKQMHNLYPDIRHGNPTQTNINQSEALYWIERVMTYISYLSRISKKLKKN